ncbi:hypothetical protein BDY24DRAFT_436660 [Mrakia frigida]|uniref:uncharacterized protein n=1 Tax=Mrakia frigida TaxID=29902 RepID=UPI003FCC26AC
MSSSREGRAPPPPSSFARTPSHRSSVSPDNRRQSAIYVGKIPLSLTPTKDSSSTSPLDVSTASTSSSSSSSNRSSSSLQHQQHPSNTTASSSSKRPSPSTTTTARRSSLQNGLPSPPFTSSEGSGGSVRQSNPPPPPPPPPSSFQQQQHLQRTNSGQSEEDIDSIDRSLGMDGQEEQHESASNSRRSSLTSSGREQRGGEHERDQRIRDLKERNVKIIDHLATLSSSPSSSNNNNARYSESATPSPTRSSYRTAPPSSSSNSTTSSSKSARRSSLPAPPSTSNGRLIKPPLRDDAGWEVSAGEETERAFSHSSGGGSPSGSGGGGGGWGERDLQQHRRPNLNRAGFSGSSAEGGEYRLPPSLASPSHERTSSLGSEGSLSRRSSRSGGSRGGAGGPSASLHAQSQSMSSLDPPCPPPNDSKTPTSRVARDTPSSLRTTALHRSQSTSTTGSGSSAGRPALPSRQGSHGSSSSRVVASPVSNRSRAGSGGSPSPGSIHQTLRISPSVRSSRGSLASLATGRDASPSPRSQQQQPSSAARSTFASRQAVRSNSQASSLASPFSSPEKEVNGRGSTTETVGRRRTNGAESSMAGGGEEKLEDRATRERQTSGGSKRRAPLPMEFRNDGSPPEPAPSAPRNPRITTTAPTLSKRSVDLTNNSHDRASPNRSSPDFYTASGSSTLTHNTSPRISRVLPPSRSRTTRGNGYDEQDRPRYLRRGGSAESALAEKDGKRGDGDGKDLFSREEKSAGDGTREILARIERETAEREAKKRELLESQALRRAESVMALSEANQHQQERTYQHHDRPESSMSRTEDFNRRFPPRTPTASTTRNSIRHTPQTMAPLRPSTAMSSFMDDAPRTAPPIGQHQLRSHRSIYNIQAAAAREDASPSPSQLLRSRNAMNNDLNRAAAGTPTRQSTFDRNQSLRRAATPSSSSPYHPRAMTSIDFPTSSSSHSNFSSNSTTSATPIENMVKAFSHLESYYSPLSLASSEGIIRSANGVMSAAENTNTSIAQVLAFTRQQIVDAQVNDMPLDFLDGLNQVSFDLKEAKKSSDEEIRQLVELMAALPRLGRELGAAGGGGGSSDGGRGEERAVFAGVRSRHSSLEKGGSPLLSRNESRRSIDFHSREASEPAPSRYTESHYSRPSTSQAYPITTSPSARFQRDTLQPRPRLPSIPSVRQFAIDARAAADSSSTSTVSAAPFPRTGDSSTSLNSQTLSPPRKRTSVLAHVFDRFASSSNRQQQQEDPSPSSSSANDQLPSPDRTWRQNKLSSTSTVRATSLFPSGPKVSEPTTAISTVTATHGSPSRTSNGLPLDPESYDEDDSSPRPRVSATQSFLNRARTLSMHPGAESGSSSRRREGEVDSRRASFAEDEGREGEGSGSRRGSNATSEESADRRRRMSLPPAGSMTSTSPSSVLRRLPGIFGGGASPKKQQQTGLP